MITQNNSISKFIAAGILVLAFTFSATAQTTDNDKIIGRAEILTGIDVIQQANLDFGYVSPGIDKSVDLSDVATPLTSNQANVSTGKFKVTAGVAASVLITFTLPTTLDKGTDQLLINNWVASYNSTASPVTGATQYVPVSGNSTQVYGATTNFPSTGELYVYLGGRVQPTNTQASGVYQSDITLTATYN